MRQADIIYPVGTKVVKTSGKPFKSGLKYATVKDVVDHPYKIHPETNKGVQSYTFVEDDSIVECAACEKMEEQQ